VSSSTGKTAECRTYDSDRALGSKADAGRDEVSETTNIELAGPWASLRTVAEYLHLREDEVKEKVNRRQLLACKFRDGNIYFPARRFMNGAIVNGLSEVLDTLAGGIDSPQVWSTWMAAAPKDGISAWEQLRKGGVEEVLAEALRDALEWSR
jgi:hypothetical protein